MPTKNNLPTTSIAERGYYLLVQRPVNSSMLPLHGCSEPKSPCLPMISPWRSVCIDKGFHLRPFYSDRTRAGWSRLEALHIHIHFVEDLIPLLSTEQFPTSTLFFLISCASLNCSFIAIANSNRCKLNKVLTDNSSGSKITVKEYCNEDAQCSFVVDKILELTSSSVKGTFG
ncbi:unnamed protein product [Lactuca virosa]|uniref:Uncharacterized protein n=1 Tax=Lactuca virosa TaxID=75947 RepID=A0AAU9PR59_9ASTR|nr:unnamed protein product [Lactuca virosa]